MYNKYVLIYLSSILAKNRNINRNKIYWYNNETLLVSDPDYWEDGTQFSIGKYIVEFNSEADADGNRFIVTTQ